MKVATRNGAMVDVVVGHPLRRWHTRLEDRLKASGHRVRFILRQASAPPPGLWLLAFERRLYGLRSRLFEPMAAPPSTPSTSPSADVTLWLDGTPPPDRAVLTLRFDDGHGDAALIGAILAGRSPRISVAREGAGSRPNEIVVGHAAIEDAGSLARALDAVLGRLVVLLAQAVERAGDHPMSPLEPAAPGVAGSALSFAVQTLRRKVERRMKRSGDDHWHAAWRRSDATDDLSAFSWPDDGYRVLPDDGSAYYADPFPFTHLGRGYIFCEAYPYATRKGVIVVFEIEADGSVSAPRVVLEHEAHLSYPQIIARDGVVYMLPEMGASGRIELFRAERFPDRWVSQAVLVEGVAAYDATYTEFGGRCWLFASVAEPGTSSWDQLALFHAPSLDGPWQAHRGNPVLIDAGAARPAGAMWVENDVLWRVAQDCRTGYGAGLSLCRVDRLDEEGFTQSVVRRLSPPPGLLAEGAHTLNRSAGLEVVDWRRPRRRER